MSTLFAASVVAEQVRFIQASCAAYDSGDELEAKRLAVPLRVLLYDGGRSKSLLGQLGLKRIGFFDGAGDLPPGNRLTEWRLVRMYASSGSDSRFQPLLDDSPIGEGKPISFGRWWTKPVFRDTEREELGRKDIVLSVANQDGGAHVDRALNARYARLTRHNSLGWVQVSGEEERPMPPPHFAALRQIAHEVMKSLERRVAPVDIPASTPSRNGPCPCGSRKKYKKCCGIAG